MLDQKVDKKSLTTALIDPLYFHYGKYLMNEQLGIKYFYPPFKQWNLNVVSEVGILTAIRILSLSTDRNSISKGVGLSECMAGVRVNTSFRETS